MESSLTFNALRSPSMRFEYFRYEMLWINYAPFSSQPPVLKLLAPINHFSHVFLFLNCLYVLCLDNIELQKSVFCCLTWKNILTIRERLITWVVLLYYFHFYFFIYNLWTKFGRTEFFFATNWKWASLWGYLE